MPPGLHSDTDILAALIRGAGRRDAPPAQAAARVWPAVEAAWQTKLRQRRRGRVAMALAAAAALVASATVLWQARLPAPVAVTAGHIDRIVGVVESRAPGTGAWQRTVAAAGQSLVAGSALRTGEGGLAGILLPSGASLRLAARTELELNGPGRIRLLRGRIYADSGPEGRYGPLEIVTPAGIAQDFGTQFEVRMASGRMRLRVREGRVVLALSEDRLVARAGEQLEVDSSGSVSRGAILAVDPEWNWAESLAPAPDIDGQPVRMLLEWVGRETGRPLRYASAEVQVQADATILHGRIGHLSPLEALDVMLATTDLGYAILDDGTIEVNLK